ncbi:hypothetical protein HYW21_06445 [Candidatus Woesearchaeota archaeon]|nr:hypothetical protein [Candidatus Woesearchaeota archaeon]
MEAHYREIKRKYDEFSQSLLRQGMLPLRDTQIGFWGIAPSDEVFTLFTKIKLHHYGNFIDLGSGDGRVVLIASLFTNATGIEFDPWLVENAQKIQQSLSVIPSMRRARFIQDDFRNHHLSAYDLVFIHPDQPMHRNGLDNKLNNELEGRLVIFGPHFHPRDLKKEATYDIQGSLISTFVR